MPEQKGEPEIIGVPDDILRGLGRLVEKSALFARAQLLAGWSKGTSCDCSACDLVEEWSRFKDTPGVIAWLDGVINGGGSEVVVTEVSKWRRN